MDLTDAFYASASLVRLKCVVVRCVLILQGFYKTRNTMNFEKSADTKVLESVLAELKVGDLITYEELSKAIGRDVRQFALPSLRSARHGLLNSKKMVFGVEHGVGYRRLNDTEVVDSIEMDRKKMSRAANRSIRKLGTVDYDKLSHEKKKQHVIASAQMGAIALFSGKNAAKKIAEKVDESKKTLAIGETLSMFT